MPTRFGDYSPSNFRDVYHGTLSVREALQDSLNIPAVAFWSAGPGRVAARLHRSGIPLYWRNTQVRPGLPMVLGGVGSTLDGLVTMYLAIANGGEAKPLRFSATDNSGSSQPLLSAAASWYLTRILEQAPPPGAVVAADHLHRRAGSRTKQGRPTDSAMPGHWGSIRIIPRCLGRTGGRFSESRLFWPQHCRAAVVSSFRIVT
ncbi:MAG: hypothetical protein HC808_07720 [Candidatus Competibacteraceae bacterium]|nr:hypothetical protein [Candidatus Competibacteraceae bacterium]